MSVYHNICFSWGEEGFYPIYHIFFPKPRIFRVFSKNPQLPVNCQTELSIFYNKEVWGERWTQQPLRHVECVVLTCNTRWQTGSLAGEWRPTWILTYALKPEVTAACSNRKWRHHMNMMPIWNISSPTPKFGNCNFISNTHQNFAIKVNLNYDLDLDFKIIKPTHMNKYRNKIPRDFQRIRRIFAE